MVKKIFLAGEWRLGRGEPSKSFFPADMSLNAEFSTASLEDVEEAIVAADRAWRDPSWRDLLPTERARILFKFADILERDREALAQLQTRDNGKPLYETRGLVASAIATTRYVASTLETMDNELTNQRMHDAITLSLYEPLGVIAAITPWNSPIASEVQKLIPALAGGNAVILKPAEATSLIALELAACFEEAGLPKGILSVLPGRGSVVGNAIVNHPLVKKISFTGGTNTGRALAHIAAERLITTSLELGGKSPTIVLEDANLELAVNGVIYGIFSSAGQACIAGSRLFVHRSLYAPFLAKLIEKSSALRVGHPEDPTTQVGPVISEQHLESIDRYVQQAVAEGGKIEIGGKRLLEGSLAKGSYYAPTIITGLKNSDSVCQEEIFGPVLVVLPFDDEATLIAEANDSIYGLSAGIWTENYRRAWQLARVLEAGTVWVNTYKKFSISTPFGGYKESGIGREKGRLGILAYMQQKSIFLSLDERPNPWCE
ncbi:aldehyde dehydrogenase [Ignatzschineria cameli]|uniref:Aldehyde dehydrogenase n=1 Tax=Ignatzschineria cameli TaxID=2182793 RepID=A0A2U2AR80_9GAMM|nr:aldehyde dehydrogenase [Ignatzschineria cameli]PWD89761.1 aldehyde dehydrogenase [Ignatzschineria cameli]PWD91411.1 aldehyde dehydrogenase [Ignatzschineria cameli]PWD92449.1 aldehyde dehydrogenase [Ignatzschineria cameli]